MSNKKLERLIWTVLLVVWAWILLSIIYCSVRGTCEAF